MTATHATMKKKHILISILAFVVTLNAQDNDIPTWSLQQCIDYALKHSPSLERQKITVRSQKFQTVIEKARFDWSVSASDSYAFAKPESNAANITLNKEFQSGVNVRAGLNASHVNNSDYTDTALAIQISKQILGGGNALETRYNLEASLIDELIQLNNLKRAERRLILDVTLAYYTIIRAQQSLTVKERALENAKRNLLLTREREKPLDILTAELRIPNNELQVNSAIRSIANGIDTLKEIIGYDVDKQLNITGQFDYQVKDVNPQDDLEFAEENLESILNNKLEKTKLKWLLEIRDSNTLPDLVLSATHRQRGDGDNYNLNGDDEQILSLSFNWTIGRRADLARLQIAHNNVQRNNSESYSLKQEITANIGNYKRRLDEYARAVELQERQCELLKRQEELYKDRWENGEIDILELVRTQTDLENSYVDLIGSKINYLELLANYQFLIGK